MKPRPNRSTEGRASPAGMSVLYLGARWCYGRSQPQFPDVKVAILAITTKAADPGAVKRECVWVDRRNVNNLSFDTLKMDP
ncbi:hypothetical protein F9K97_19170 [Brucella anthropi]|uniref:hypothetical protein n=1 Tax=Brucella anthropi TaxID=529 RepID=UPI00124D6247|nr:hypothetical protein [Brucella anthropi]KAB2784193.1 hypothetical protein F9K97_19170 [Brucella anthropi]KAB2793207.1 hypothetical protein F9K87_21410 [Brucella anthropi]